MLSKNRNFFYLIQDIAGEESSECATQKRKAQSISSAITSWRKLSNILVVIPSQYSYFNAIPSVGVEMILVALLSLYYKYYV